MSRINNNQDIRSTKGVAEYIDTGCEGALDEFCSVFTAVMNGRDSSEATILCIGSDRTTGDCFGPIVGHMLERAIIGLSGVRVIGTLNRPVHAKNVADVIGSIYSNDCKPLVIAVDACLGKIEHVGHIGIGAGALRPGAGLGKCLPEVGDVYITGVVNYGGVMNFEILRNTRLGLVMRMAEIAYHGIIRGVRIWRKGANLDL